MTIDDRKLSSDLARLRDDWRVAPQPPLDAMWQDIEARAFPAGGIHAAPGPSPMRRWLPLAAMLAVGFGIGQLAPRLGGAAPADDLAAIRADSINRLGTLAASDQPFVGIASGYLEQVTALLVTLANETEQGRPLDNSRAQAQDLLATTRLLLDSPGQVEHPVAGLLDDLELVLVQIARLPNRPSGPDVYLIDQALDQHDVLPRLRVMLANAQDNRPY
jgi:hypothetical protein